MTELRATPALIDQQDLNDIDANMNQQAITQEDLSTGYMVNQPSDSPSEIGDILSSNALITRTSQYVTNANDGEAFLSQANSAMNQVTSLLQQAQQLVASVGGPDTQENSTATADGLATQLQGIYNNLLTLANSTYLGIPIFGGTVGAGTQAFDANGDYTGTSTALTRTVAPGVSLQAGVVGSKVFGDAANPATSVFGVLTQTINDLQAGDYGDVTGTDQGNLSNVYTQVVTAGATIGALYQTMQTAQQTASTTQTTLQNQLSNTVDTNVAQATTNLQQEQDTYQSALYAISQVQKYSLVQFMS